MTTLELLEEITNEIVSSCPYLGGYRSNKYYGILPSLSDSVKLCRPGYPTVYLWINQDEHISMSIIPGERQAVAWIDYRYDLGNPECIPIIIGAIGEFFRSVE